VRYPYRRAPVRRPKKAAPAPGSWPLLVINSEPIRKKAKREYEKVLRELDGAKAQIERHHKEDKPAFKRWLSKNFGALLTDLRELEKELLEVEDLVNEVQQEFYFGSYRSIHKAYERVKRKRANPDAEEEDSKEGKTFRDAADEFERMVDEMFSDAAEREESGNQGNPEGPRSNSSREKKISLEQQHRQNRIKELYRALVRRLHPDQAEKLTPKHVEWWHQTQAAYESENVEQLELIFTLTEIERGGTKEASISILKKLILQFKQALKSVKQEVKKLSGDPAWDFASLQDYTALFRKTQYSLEQEKTRMIFLTQKYTAQILQWEESLKKPQTARRAGRRKWQDEEWF
jgi:hypothetical protein